MYRFLQLHFHWRNAHSKGSEHAIDGQKFTMEVIGKKQSLSQTHVIDVTLTDAHGTSECQIRHGPFGQNQQS